MSVQIGYEVEMATPCSETNVRRFFENNGMAVKPGRAENHAGPYNAWGIAIDGSVRPTDARHNKFELISPIMTLDESIETMHLMFDWMNSTGGYTNNSCGFHVGVSLTDPEKMRNINRLKLMMLLDEGKLLNDFGRTNNQWAYQIIPALKSNIRHNVRGNIADAFEAVARRCVPVSKMFSINLSRLPDYVEFRIMGGNYSTQFDKCRDTILEYVDCMKAACDPEIKNLEYKAKLDEFMNSLFGENPEIARYFREGEAVARRIIERDISRRRDRVQLVTNPMEA